LRTQNFLVDAFDASIHATDQILHHFLHRPESTIQGEGSRHLLRKPDLQSQLSHFRTANVTKADQMQNHILVTGGAGFIGANFVCRWIATEGTRVINLDSLTYAGNLSNLESLRHDSRHFFIRGDIKDQALVTELLLKYRPRAIVHFAAESHVDRAIVNPEEFIHTNIVGTFRLLEAARNYWEQLRGNKLSRFVFLHVSSDEVYGALRPNENPFQETTPYAPSSPYSASKAAADHLVRAYYKTYGLPVLITHCSNNYGPFQFPEKLIPLMILNATRGLSLPVYGDGQQVRDWLYVTDHCDAIRMVLAQGRVGETYNIGGCTEKTNLEVVNAICSILDELRPRPGGTPHSSLITHIKDRPGHDRRYAVNTTKIQLELGWRPTERFETGIHKTVEWYLQNLSWVSEVSSGKYRDWLRVHYATAS
jgi:dTDP-glucose 4,6-dehydratase